EVGRRLGGDVQLQVQVEVDLRRLVRVGVVEGQGHVVGRGDQALLHQVDGDVALEGVARGVLDGVLQPGAQRVDRVVSGQQGRERLAGDRQRVDGVGARQLAGDRGEVAVEVVAQRQEVHGGDLARFEALDLKPAAARAAGGARAGTGRLTADPF